MMRIFTLGLMMLVFGYCEALDLDKSCHTMVLKTEQLALKVKKAALVVIHNKTDKQVWITHPVDATGASAGWSSQLDVKRWSALFINPGAEAFNLACVESSPGHEQYRSCADVIEICILPTEQIPPEADSPFWAVENLGKKSLIPHLQQRGFDWPEADAG